MSKRPAPTPRERANRAKELAPRMREAWIEGVAMGAMLAVANDDAGLRRLFDGEREAMGFRLVYGALLVRVSLCLTSLWDPPRNDRASVPTVVGLIAEPEVRRLLRRDAYGWLRAGFGRLRRRNALAAGRKLRSALVAYRRLDASTEHTDQLAKLRHLRNEHFAHALVGLPPKDGPRYGWLHDLYRDTASIVADLHFALAGNADLDEHEADAREDAEAFWDAARRGMVELRSERA